MRNIAGRKGLSAQAEPMQKAQQTKRNDRLIEMAAEQLAVLLWKTWLHKKRIMNKRNKKKNSY